MQAKKTQRLKYSFHDLINGPWCRDNSRHYGTVFLMSNNSFGIIGMMLQKGFHFILFFAKKSYICGNEATNL